jgi:hypothetical protein
LRIAGHHSDLAVLNFDAGHRKSGGKNRASGALDVAQLERRRLAHRGNSIFEPSHHF